MAGSELLVLCTSPLAKNQGNKGGHKASTRYPYTTFHQGLVGFLTEAVGWQERRLLTGQEEMVHAGTRRLEQLAITWVALKNPHNLCFSSTLARDATSLLVSSTLTRKPVGISKTASPAILSARTASTTTPAYELPALPAKPFCGEHDYGGADREDFIGRADVARGGIAAWCIFDGPYRFAGLRRALRHLVAGPYVIRGTKRRPVHTAASESPTVRPAGLLVLQRPLLPRHLAARDLPLLGVWGYMWCNCTLLGHYHRS